MGDQRPRCFIKRPRCYSRGLIGVLPTPLATSLNHALHDEIVDGKAWRYTGEMIPIQAPLEALLSTIIDPDSGINKSMRHVASGEGANMPKTIDGPFMLELLVRFPRTFPIQVPNEPVVDTYHQASGPFDFLEGFYTIFQVDLSVWDLPIKNILKDPSMRMSNKATERLGPGPEPYGT